MGNGLTAGRSGAVFIETSNGCQGRDGAASGGRPFCREGWNGIKTSIMSDLS